ncbi:MAG: hypothetical protein QMD10_10925 [Desulfitobacteriaceae bacterium]|nr:hypothetical protein [Desulfitobacteriaceae bacterium]
MGEKSEKLPSWLKPVALQPKYQLTHEAVKDLLKKAFPDCPLWLLDGRYWATNYQLVKFILHQVDAIDMRKYEEDAFDCDDFALALMALWRVHYGLNTIFFAAGDTPFGPHAFNLAVADPVGKGESFQVYFIEPQTDGIWGLGENGKRFKYKPVFIMG